MAERSLLGPNADRFATRTLLGLTLVLSCVVGLVTPFLLGVLGLVLLVAVLVRRQVRVAYASIGARLFALAFVLIAVCFTITAQTPQDAVFVFNFIALLLFGPFVLLLERNAGGAMLTVSRLAATGAALAFAVAVLARYGLGYERADTPLLGAILLGNTAILLGFLAVTGVLLHPDKKRRWLFLLPPLLGIATVAITASRGPMLSIAPLVILCAIVIATQLRASVIVVASATLAGLAVSVLILFGLNDRIPTLFGIANDVASGTTVADVNTSIRLALYEGGFRAFLEAPVFGHGWARLMSAVAPYLTDEMQAFLGLPHLHNDVVDFGVAAGGVGIAVYILIMVTPLIAAWRSPRDRLYPHRFFGVAILCVAYAFDGLTDLMFGMEYHTMLYVCLTAILIGYCREPAP